MSLQYYLIPNYLTTDSDRYVARILSHRVLDTKALVTEILRRGSTLTEVDIMAVLSIMFEVVADEVAEGNTVNLPLINIRPSIGGYFSGSGDTFDSKRHKTRATISEGTLLRKKMEESDAELVTKVETGPMVRSYTDLKNTTDEVAATPGGIARIEGTDLKFDDKNPVEGIFFIDETGEETRVSLIETRFNSKLVFENPDSLRPGSYFLEVRKAYGTVNPVLRTSTYQKPIAVK